MTPSAPRLPREYLDHYDRHRAIIDARLSEFLAVPPERYLVELFYCLLTPQSKARHAATAVARLLELGFPEIDVDPAPILRDPAAYIRFHNQKARRLREAAVRRREIVATLTDLNLDARGRREWLVANVNGLGWKEASHFLRNIGHLELAIIDRHVLKHMLRLGAIDRIPASVASRRTYLDLEERFSALALASGLSLQQLDLLLWSLEEGSVRK